MSFLNVFRNYSWNEIQNRIISCTDREVENSLAEAGNGTPEHFMALVSPAAEKFLEPMARLSRAITRKRFGNTIQMYLPLYLSNECQNICTYCGFSMNHSINRVTLNEEQILNEARVICEMGYKHVLLVTGESAVHAGTDYIENAVRLLRPFFSSIQIEVQPLHSEEYVRMHKAGVNTVLVYQETYHQERYNQYHVKGKKKNFQYRIETPDRIGQSGMHKIGLGVLLGLEDWRTDSFFTALHLNYLEKKYWQSKFSVSFPRLRPAAGCQPPDHPVRDKHVLQLICAFRIFNENLELSLSTRESPSFRNHVAPLGITSMSAGSRTNPGAYASHLRSLEQFEIQDERSPGEVAAMLQQQDLEPVWKDWDHVFHATMN